MNKRLYVIEARHADGTLALEVRQPESVFGIRAIHGMDEDEMAKCIFARVPGAILTGDTVDVWPRLVNGLWTARVKTW
jgi:hypothetical protein